jgi:aspartyl protease family protein
MSMHYQTDPLAHRHLGRVMIIAAWVVGLVLLVILFQGVLDSQRNPNREPSSRIGRGGAAEVVLVQNRAGHYVASGRVNGRPVTFLLDTGATQVAVSRDLADALGLDRGPAVSTQTANGPVTAWTTRLDRIELGAISLRGVRAVILPTLPSDEVLLGMSFLKRLELIQRGQTLTLRHQGA